MTRRLLISYLSLTVVVLAMLEVPLGFVNARGERAQLTAKVERDAVTIASLAESTIEGDAPTSNLPAIEALGRRYADDTGARVVITDGKGISVVDSAPPTRAGGASRPGPSSGLRCAATSRRERVTRARSATTSSTSRCRSPRAAPSTEPSASRTRRPSSTGACATTGSRSRGSPSSSSAVAALIGLSFARWIRRPLAGLEVAAAEAGAGDLSARAPVPDAPPELRRLALEFNDMVARVDGLVSVQKEFVADASHELRTPLTALRLRLENLGRHVGDDGRASLEAAETEVERLSGLVDELLALARADAGTAPAETVDLAAVAADRIEVWLPTAGESRLQLEARARQGAGRPRPGRPGDRQPPLERAAARARELRHRGLRGTGGRVPSSSASPTRAPG